MARRAQVDDRQSTMDHRDTRVVVSPDAPIIGTAMTNRITHRNQTGFVNSTTDR
jgi:hypothetical protein